MICKILPFCDISSTALLHGKMKPSTAFGCWLSLSLLGRCTAHSRSLAFLTPPGGGTAGKGREHGSGKGDRKEGRVSYLELGSCRSNWMNSYHLSNCKGSLLRCLKLTQLHGPTQQSLFLVFLLRDRTDITIHNMTFYMIRFALGPIKQTSPVPLRP